MLNDSSEDIKILTKLGLTLLQAQVYLTLAKMDKATIKIISSIAQIDRANVYRVLIRLQQLDLVEKLLTTPINFRALSVHEGVKMLLDRKEADDEAIKAKTCELLKKYEHSIEENPDERGAEFVLIPDGKLTSRKVTEMVNSNQKTHDLIIYWSDFTLQLNDVVERWTKLLLRGIKLRVIVFLQKNERLPKKVECLKKYATFQIKRISNPPKATISIIDGKQAFLSVMPSLCPRGKPGLWVNNSGIVGLIQDYFDMVWRDSKDLL
jgi:sugar-specific transcriptional regulator TrmB